ncbi:MAG: acyl-CoA dehydrogenase family protein [Gracilibacteraceae bacterium]|jgi:alkylation response protein AidB-like acyl-CoA dehydrogenase|nr:acyl-CoA dehydrogenase family protein [Gracilibacteraceae bacterium]
MEFRLNEIQQIVQDTAREIATKEITKYVDEIEKTHSVPEALMKTIADAGIPGIPFAEAYGGVDAGYIAMSCAYEEIAKVCPSVSVSLLVCISFLEAVKNYGNEEQIKKYVPAGIRGEFRGSLAFTEPGTGSDPKQITTTAKKEGEYYILNGTKRFITNAAYSGPILLFARDSETQSITAFVFDKLGEGYSTSTPWDVVGMRGSAIYDVFLDNVKVHESGILGKPGEGFPVLLGTVAHSKVALCATFVGTMATSYALAVKYAKEKMHRDKPISKFPSIQLKIAQIAAKLESARLLTRKLSEESDDHSRIEHMKAWVGMVKAFVSDVAVETNLLAMNVLGAYGVTEEYKVERFLRDALIAPHIEGVSDLQRVIAGSYILGSDDALV